jgi:hypothetical protein
VEQNRKLKEQITTIITLRGTKMLNGTKTPKWNKKITHETKQDCKKEQG